MQFHALDDNLFILASSAQKQKKYRCPECLSIVKVRGGPHRQLHFYHLATSKNCRQNKKSLTHLHIQLLLQFLLKEQVFLEYRFPQIGRIADVYWQQQKIVFEVQCSPISLEEAKERCEDYKKLGLHPIFILHDHRFNRRYCSAAEIFLRKEGCLFTNGKDLFYDQVEVCKGAKRIYRGPRLTVHPDKPLFIPVLHFEGDKIARKIPSPDLKPFSSASWKQRVKRIYISCFHLLLEHVK